MLLLYGRISDEALPSELNELCGKNSAFFIFV